jgi:hypothetical protein
LAVAHFRLAPTSSASISVTDCWFVRGFPAVLAQPPGDHDRILLGQGVGQLADRAVQGSPVGIVGALELGEVDRKYADAG